MGARKYEVFKPAYGLACRRPGSLKFLFVALDGYTYRLYSNSCEGAFVEERLGAGEVALGLWELPLLPNDRSVALREGCSRLAGINRAKNLGPSIDWPLALRRAFQWRKAIRNHQRRAALRLTRRPSPDNAIHP
jgi:hypothetical protein